MSKFVRVFLNDQAIGRMEPSRVTPRDEQAWGVLCNFAGRLLGASVAPGAPFSEQNAAAMPLLLTSLGVVDYNPKTFDFRSRFEDNGSAVRFNFES